MRIQGVAMVAVLTALMAVPAMAQRPGGGGPRFGGGGFGRGGGGYIGLLSVEEVRKEIELLDDQWTQIQKIGEDARNAAQQSGQGFDREAFAQLSEEERNKRIAEMTEQFQKRTNETNAKVKEVLLPHQTERLDQLALQQRGVRALADAEVAGKLQLTEDQKKKLQAIQDEESERRRAAFENRGEGGRPNFNFEEMRAQAEKVEQDMLAVLNDQQKKSFDEMKGKPFTFPQPQFGRGGNRGNREGGRTRPETE